MKNREVSKKLGIKFVSVMTMMSLMAAGLVGCGSVDNISSVYAAEDEMESDAETDVLTDVMEAQAGVSHSTSGNPAKEEIVYVLADANGATNKVIVSDWLKNTDADSTIEDVSSLSNIENVSGDETYVTDVDGKLMWAAGGNDIHYQGTTDAALPVDVKVTYYLDGNEITPNELAGKSGRVTIRFDYTNNEKRTVEIGGVEKEIYVPFTMMSGAVFDNEHFSNIEVTNGRVIDSGNSTIVMGMAFPGLSDSLNIADLKDKLNDGDNEKEKEEKQIPEYVEISVDATDFTMNQTMTMAMSDVLSSLNLDSELDIDTSRLNDSMDELEDGASSLADGSSELHDGSLKLLDGAKTLADKSIELDNGAKDLLAGAGKLDSGAGELKDGISKVNDGAGALLAGAGKLDSGAGELKDGIGQVNSGASTLKAGAGKLDSGAGELKDGIDQVNQGASTLKAGAGKLDSGAGELKDGIGKLSIGAATLAEGSTKVDAGADNLKTGAAALYAGTSALATKAPELSAGANQILDGSKALGTGLTTLSSGADQLYAAADAAYTMTYGSSWTGYGQTGGGKSAQMEQVSEAVTSLSEMMKQDTEEFAALISEYESELGAMEATLSSDRAEIDSLINNPTVENVEIVTGSTEVTGEYTYTTAVTNNSYYSYSAPSSEEGEEEAASGDGSYSLENSETSEETSTGTYTYEKYETGNKEVYMYDVAAISAALDRYASDYEEYSNLKASYEGYKEIVNYFGEYSSSMSTLKSQIDAYGVTPDAQSLLYNVCKGLYGLTTNDGSGSGAIAKLIAGNSGITTGVETLKAGADTAVAGVANLNDGAKQLADGTVALKAGTSELSTGATTLKTGADDLNKGAGTLKAGTSELNAGAQTLSDGTGKLLDGAGTLKAGTSELNSGAGKLKDGTGKFVDGTKELYDGTLTLSDGTKELMDGMFKFKSEGIDKLYKLFGDDIEEALDTLSAVMDAGNDYNIFSDVSEGLESSVKFIYKTEAI